MLAKIHALNIDFKISPLINNLTNTHLLVELGNNTISFLVYEDTPLCFTGFFMHKMEHDVYSNEYLHTLESILNDNSKLLSSFASTKVFYNTAQSTLVPTSYFVETEKENILNLLFGENASTYCFKDTTKVNDIKLVYRVQNKLYDEVNILFPKSTFMHATAAQIDNINASETLLKCIVYNNSIKVLYFKEGKVQIVQFFNYAVPADASYHLLNVCEQFDIDVNTIQLQLSGLIEEKSNLYQDIYKYFLNITLAKLDSNVSITEELNSLPQHYYSPLVELAQCV